MKFTHQDLCLIIEISELQGKIEREKRRQEMLEHRKVMEELWAALDARNARNAPKAPDERPPDATLH